MAADEGTHCNAQHVAAKRRPQDGKLVHVESSGLKAAATWHRIEILQNCRECCGGMGFLSANKIGPMLGKSFDPVQPWRCMFSRLTYTQSCEYIRQLYHERVGANLRLPTTVVACACVTMQPVLHLTAS